MDNRWKEMTLAALMAAHIQLAKDLSKELDKPVEKQRSLDELEADAIAGAKSAVTEGLSYEQEANAVNAVLVFIGEFFAEWRERRSKI